MGGHCRDLTKGVDPFLAIPKLCRGPSAFFGQIGGHVVGLVITVKHHKFHAVVSKGFFVVIKPRKGRVLQALNNHTCGNGVLHGVDHRKHLPFNAADRISRPRRPCQTIRDLRITADDFKKRHMQQCAKDK